MEAGAGSIEPFQVSGWRGGRPMGFQCSGSMRARKNNVVKLEISKIRAGKLAARGEFVPNDGSSLVGESVSRPVRTHF